jgi:peptidoglycan/xylan/chitin deacetylase (PgdA/CDA1 family)
VRTVRGYIGALLVQYERRAVQLIALTLLCVPLALVAVPPFGRAPKDSAEPRLQAQRPAISTKKLVLPKPHAGDAQARAVDALARRGVAIRSGGGKRRWVALTFDDGPGPYTSQLLAELDRLQVPATFFQVGKMLQQFPGPGLLTANTPRLTIGDHTYSHGSLLPMTRRRQAVEILQAAAVMEQLGELPPRLFRPPYGAWDADTRTLTAKRGMAIILWNVDSEDYTRPGAEQIADNVVRDVRPGSIVLMHDGGGDRTQTIEALPKIVRRLRRRGYGLVTVDRLIAEDPPFRKDDFGRIGHAPSGESGAP